MMMILNMDNVIMLSPATCLFFSAGWKSPPTSCDTEIMMNDDCRRGRAW